MIQTVRVKKLFIFGSPRYAHLRNSMSRIIFSQVLDLSLQAISYVSASEIKVPNTVAFLLVMISEAEGMLVNVNIGRPWEAEPSRL